MMNSHSGVCLLWCSILCTTLSYAADKDAAKEDAFAGAKAQAIAMRPTAELSEKVAYFKDQNKIGERVYYRNGKLAEQTPFTEGVIDGVVTQFYPSGKIFAQRPYTRGKLNGVVKFFGESGQLLGESRFENGTGRLHQFPLAALAIPHEVEIPFNNGIVEGIRREHIALDENGSVGTSLVEYENGMMSGWSVTVDEKGAVVSSALMVNGKLNCVFRKFVRVGVPADGFPKYFIAGRETTQTDYIQQAKTDPTLAKTVNDDGAEWAKSTQSKLDKPVNIDRQPAIPQ